jgi:hypothetical protein
MKFRVFWDVARVVTLKWTDVSEVRTASIIRAMMEAILHCLGTFIAVNSALTLPF